MDNLAAQRVQIDPTTFSVLILVLMDDLAAACFQRYSVLDDLKSKPISSFRGQGGFPPKNFAKVLKFFIQSKYFQKKISFICVILSKIIFRK